MAKAIKRVNLSGDNGIPPKTGLKGEGINRKEVVNIPGGTPARNTKGPGPSGKGLSKGRKPAGKDKVGGGKLNISKPGGGIKVKSSKTGRSPRGRKGGSLL